MSEELDGDGPEIREMIREHEDIALLKPSTCRLCQAKDQRIVAIQRQLAEAQQAQERAEADLKRLSDTRRRVIDGTDKLKAERDTLRGLLRAAQTRLSCTHLFIGYCPECRDLRQRITAALPKEGE